MSHPVYTADRAIVAQLRAIDPALSVAWLGPEERWAVFDGLQVSGNPEATAVAIARELARDYRDHGYVIPYPECLRRAAVKVAQESLVHVVQNDDGSYRPLDHRVVDKFRRMDWFRRNYWLNDYLRHARGDARKAYQSRQRDTANVWESIEKDKVFQRMASDLLLGYHPVDSVSFSAKEAAAA